MLEKVKRYKWFLIAIALIIFLLWIAFNINVDAARNRLEFKKQTDQQQQEIKKLKDENEKLKIPKATPPKKVTPKVQTPKITAKASKTFTVTGYSQSAEEGTADGITASGKLVAYGVCAADTNYYPFGTKFNIPGYGICTVWDTGSAIKGNRIDAFFPTRQEAFAWGTKTINVEIL